ncbi:MAG: prepilin peptidase [Alphaproteobacteria bacterium]|nr:prepilin peptidase [Alphaproteobacteria bacterium]
MSIETIVLTLVLGLICGSFISALSYRIPRELPFKTDRSKCQNCQHVLSALDLIPLLSWLMQKGHCRYCQQPISTRYPIIELLTTLTFLTIVYVINDPIQATLMCLLSFFLILLSVIDFETGLLPSNIIFSMFPFAIAYRYYLDGDNVIYGFAGAIIAVTAGLLLNAIYKKIKKRDGIGMGDVRFCLVIGTLLSLQQWAVFLFIAGLLGVITGIVWNMTNKGKIFPFGPSIMISLFTCLIIDKKINIFLQFLN